MLSVLQEQIIQLNVELGCVSITDNSYRRHQTKVALAYFKIRYVVSDALCLTTDVARTEVPNLQI